MRLAWNSTARITKFIVHFFGKEQRHRHFDARVSQNNHSQGVHACASNKYLHKVFSTWKRQRVSPQKYHFVSVILCDYLREFSKKLSIHILSSQSNYDKIPLSLPMVRLGII